FEIHSSRAAARSDRQGATGVGEREAFGKVVLRFEVRSSNEEARRGRSFLLLRSHLEPRTSFIIHHHSSFEIRNSKFIHPVLQLDQIGEGHGGWREGGFWQNRFEVRGSKCERRGKKEAVLASSFAPRTSNFLHNPQVPPIQILPSD